MVAQIGIGHWMEFAQSPFLFANGLLLTTQLCDMTKPALQATKALHYFLSCTLHHGPSKKPV